MRRLVFSSFALFAVLVLGLVFGQASVVHADDDDDAAAKATARKLLTSGDKKLKSGDRLLGRGKKVEAQEAYLGALSDYKDAYEAFSDAKIFFAIGLAEKKLGRYIEALEHFDQFLDEVGGSEALRTRVETHTDEIKMFLGVIFFRVEPDGATVTINGVDVGKAPLNRPHYVPPGDHEYTIRKDGYKSVEGTVSVEAGEAREDPFSLERDGSVIDPPIEPKKKKKKKKKSIEPTDRKSRTPLLVGLALTGTFALAGTTTGVLALSKHGTFTDTSASGSSRESARSSGKNLALATDIFLIGAIAAGTYTAYYYFAEYRGGTERAPSAGSDGIEAAAAPWVSADGAGLAIGGRF